MVDLGVLKPNKIYRLGSTKCRLSTLSEDPTHGSVYVAATKSMAATGLFFSNPMFILRYLTRYYHDRIFNYRIYNSVIRQRLADNDLKAQYDTFIEPKIPALSLALTKESLNRKNYIYDISPLNEKFFGTKDSRVGLTRVNEYFRLFKDFLSKVDTKAYTNKVLFIPINDWVPDVKDSKIYTLRSIDTFYSLFYHKLNSDPQYFKATLGDWKVYFIDMDRIFLFDFSRVNKDSAAEFKKLVFKFNIAQLTPAKVINSEAVASEDVGSVTEARNVTTITDKIVDSLAATSINLTNTSVSKLVDSTINKGNIDISSDVVLPEDITVSPKEMELEYLSELKDSTVPKSAARLGREMQLVENMKKLNIENETVEEILARVKQTAIPEMDIPINTLNPNLQKMTFPEFDKAYVDNLYIADITRIMTGLQYKDHPLYLMSTEVKDVSDHLNEVKEYTFKFEDERGGRHSFQILLPKFIDSRFMKLAGNKKIMINQMIPLPVTKTAPDTVQVASNYKKTFITRFGQSISPKVATFFKSVSELYNSKIKVLIGSSSKINSKYITTIEYDELANKYKQIVLPTITFYFNQADIRSAIDTLKLKLSANTKLLPIAIEDQKKIIYLDTDSSLIENLNIIDYLVSKMSAVEPGFEKSFKNIKPGRKYMYTRALIMVKKVPLVILLAFLDGLFTLLKKANIEYRVVSKNEKDKMGIISGEEDVIEFQDAYLIYKIYPLRNSLLMNGFSEIPTKVYDIAQFLTKDVYFEIFDTLFGRRNIGYAFENFKQLFTDPMVEDVLRDYNLPTDFVDLLLYANALLEDNAYTDEGDMHINRVRCNEMVAAFLYKVVSKAYEDYRLTANNPNPVKFSAKKDAVLIEILTNQVTQDLSDLSPLQMIETMRAITYKGPSGLNQDRAFSLKKRSFHPTMLGIISQASPISGSIGIARTLTVDANIISARGYTKVSSSKDEINSLPSTKILSGSEAMSPFSATGDEPEREAMLSAQSKHTIACVEADISPLSTGFEKALPYLIGNTFVFKAAKDGIVLKTDIENNVILIKYDDGSAESVNLNPAMGRNAGGGFYVSNRLEPNFKVGDTVKAGDIVAFNPLYFKKDKRTNNLSFVYGPLARIALKYSSKVFEDSGIISKRLSDKMGSDIVVKRDIALGKNSNIDYIVKKGQVVKVNDPLLIFDTSHDDELTNKLLARLKADDVQDLMDAAKTPIVSKYNGVIEDIKIYYTVPKEKLSDSVQKIISGFEGDNEKRVKSLTRGTGFKPEDVDISLIEIHQVNPDASGKVKGVKVDEGLLIEIYIKYRAAMGIGDKLSTSSAVKSVLCAVWEEGQEPYLLSDPNDKIDLFLGTLSIGARLTHSFLKVSLINGVLVGMKPNIGKIYEQVYGKKP